LEGKPFEVWGGDQLRDFTFVDDCVDALLLAAKEEKANGQIFNLGGSSVINLRDLAALLVELNGQGEYIVREFPIERQNIDIGDYYSDFTLIRKSLGWEPKVPLNNALQKILEYYRTNLQYYI
jgi:UDP-glucose 4-epimerase